ncbi:hypothetical protein BGZ83_005181, partial [Gryganskiella cystojenkinii]
VALSGIVDLDIHLNFPKHTRRLLDCKAVYFEYPRIHQYLKGGCNEDRQGNLDGNDKNTSTSRIGTVVEVTEEHTT